MRVVLFLGLIVSFLLGEAQVASSYWQFSGSLNTDGYALGFERTIRSSEKLQTNLLVSLGTHKHSKETQTENPTVNDGSPYVYGKLNRAYLNKTGLNFIIPLDGWFNGKSDLAWSIGAGPQFIFLQPQYIEIYQENDGQLSLSTERYDPDVHTHQEYIVGNGQITDGLSETTVRLGGFLQTGINYSWTTPSLARREVHVGMNVNFFGSSLPILHQFKSDPIQVALFASYKIGRLTKSRY
jgi:hypothetical protein